MNGKISKLNRRWVAAWIALLLLLGAAQAENLTLPKGLSSIEAEAFAGDGSIREVVIPDGATSIGARAFADCGELGWITIPGSVTELGANCLAGCAEDLLIRTTAGSAAASYARAKQFDYQADTTYRALLVGQMYEDDAAIRLYGAANDLPGMQDMLSRFPGTKYQITPQYDLTGSGILSAISQTFAGAKEQDVSLFYYTGHGTSSNEPSWQGALVGCDRKIVTANQLRAALDKIPGRKIVIIDACYSGAMISPNMPDGVMIARSSEPAAEEATEEEATAEEFVDSFISAFLTHSRGGLLGDSYFVLTAAAEDETSYEWGRDENTMMGLFTSGLIKGSGYDCINDKHTDCFADVNHNGVLTLQELFAYARNNSLSVDLPSAQHAQMYPSNCDWFGVLRAK